MYSHIANVDIYIYIIFIFVTIKLYQCILPTPLAILIVLSTILALSFITMTFTQWNYECYYCICYCVQAIWGIKESSSEDNEDICSLSKFKITSNFFNCLTLVHFYVQYKCVLLTSLLLYFCNVQCKETATLIGWQIAVILHMDVFYFYS